jgi:hypothetical protein
MVAAPQPTTEERLEKFVHVIKKDVDRMARRRDALPPDDAVKFIDSHIHHLMKAADGHPLVQQQLADITRTMRESLVRAIDDATTLAAGAQLDANDMYSVLAELEQQVQVHQLQLDRIALAVRTRDDMDPVVGPAIEHGREMERLWIEEAGYSLTADPADDVACMAGEYIHCDEDLLTDFVQLLSHKAFVLPDEYNHRLADFIHDFVHDARADGLI